MSRLGNYFNDHDPTDSDNDGVTDASYGLPGAQPDDGHPMATPFWDSRWSWDVVSEEEETITTGATNVLSVLTLSGGRVSIEGGRLTIGWFR